ncbi:hypothetical protein DL95DRAFT_527787 [Leptodontidium sp. 2 PMI_412]|nr:hypothetical protein DL95DRAFT_527787 [Leptodontidium sp. 2 PMI_412]
MSVADARGPPLSVWQDIDRSTLPEFLRDLPPRPDMSQYPTFPDDKLASFGGHGTIEARQVTLILEDAGIPCCVCGVGALMYYGAGRDWEICVPSELKERAEVLLKSDEYTDVYISLPPWPYLEPGSLSHTYTRFKSTGVSFYFVLVPSKDIHLPRKPQNFQRSHHDLPYPKLNVLIQSFLETNDHVSLADVIDGSDVSEVWGVKNLDLEGEVDLEWAEWKNRLILEHAGRAFVLGLVPIRHVEKLELWQFMVRNNGEGGLSLRSCSPRAFDYTATLLHGWRREIVARMSNSYRAVFASDQWRRI